MILSILTLTIGIILIILTLKNDKVCPPPKIQYRFVPRTFKEEQESPVKVTEIFSSMFEKPSPFLNRVSGRNVTKDTINRNFISQG
jgi:hypothetical protein